MAATATARTSPWGALRDVKLASIGGGTTEIQKLVISRMLLA